MFNSFPARFLHYEVLRLLGDGGFGSVYLARDLNLRREVVLKMLHPHLARKPQMVTRFLREARAMAGLHHANIVIVYRVENDPQQPFFEMEYVPGQTLGDYRGGRVVPLAEAIPILRQMAAALDAAHQQGIVHRDVKPGNVLIKPNGQVKLTDFGIIKLLQPIDTALPTTQGFVGTPLYMAPEQGDDSRRDEIGPPCDIYALGVVSYEMLTGRLPFEGTTHTILMAHATQAPPHPRTFNPDIPEPVAAVLLKALEKATADRYPSASHFVQALEQAQRAAMGGHSVLVSASGAGGASTPVTPFSQSVRPAPQSVTGVPQGPVSWATIVAFTVAILVAIMAGGLLNQAFFSGAEPETPVAVATFTLPPEEPTEAAPTEAPSIPPALSTATPVPPEPSATPERPSATPERPSATPVPPTPVPPSVTLVPPTATPVPTEAPIPPTEAPIPPTEAPIPPTEVPIPPTEAPIPPSPKPTLGLTMVGQDGMTLLHVPAGKFLMGSREGNPDAFGDEHPQHEVYLDAFWIDQTEVTNEMFAAFLNAMSNQEEGRATWLETSQYALISESSGTFQPKAGFADHPVIEVTWYGANAYCQWADRRLPTEAEWEKAARGTDAQKYPWGNEAPSCDLLQYAPCGANTVPVGSYAAGASPYGALDMAGNVWEWVADWYDEQYYANSLESNPSGPSGGGKWKALRGGSWHNNEARRVRAAYRGGGPPTDSFSYGGLRCARSPY